MRGRRCLTSGHAQVAERLADGRGVLGRQRRQIHQDVIVNGRTDLPRKAGGHLLNVSEFCRKERREQALGRAVLEHKPQPAALHRALIGRRALVRGLRFVVKGDRGRRVEDAGARCARAKAIIHFFIVSGIETFVQQANRFEDGPVEGEHRAGHIIGLGQGVPAPVVDLPVAMVIGDGARPADDAAGMLHGYAVRVQEFSAHNGRAGGQLRAQGRQTAGAQHHVLIDQDQLIAARQLQAAIHAARKARVLRQARQVHLRKPGGNAIGRAVARGIIDHEQLIGGGQLIADGGQTVSD